MNLFNCFVWLAPSCHIFASCFRIMIKSQLRIRCKNNEPQCKLLIYSYTNNILDKGQHGYTTSTNYSGHSSSSRIFFRWKSIKKRTLIVFFFLFEQQSLVIILGGFALKIIGIHVYQLAWIKLVGLRRGRF